MRISVSIAPAFALVTAAATIAAAEPVEKGALGVGLILGEPTGICAKLYLDDDRAIQAALGLTFVSGGLQAHADYLLHPVILEERADFTIPAYIGAGVRVMQHSGGLNEDTDFRLGARAVGGMLFDFKEIPLDVFVEVAGIVEYRFGSEDTDISGIGLALNGGLGARYYF
jgi:hypothetical protein